MINYRAIARKNQVPFATGDIRLRLILASYNLCKGASLPQGNNHFFMIVWDSRNILEDMLPTIPEGCTSKHCLFSTCGQHGLPTHGLPVLLSWAIKVLAPIGKGLSYSCHLLGRRLFSFPSVLSMSLSWLCLVGDFFLLSQWF